MPYYQVFHSHPLSAEQRQALASSITALHCSAFGTPSFFVHVQFTRENSHDEGYFLAGKPHHTNSNRIIGTVRVSASRSKSDFDTLAADIESAWDTVVEQQHGTASETKRLLMVTFVPMVTIREGGMAIPEAGHETSWLKSQLPYIKSQAEGAGIAEFVDLLAELKERDGLKEFL
jgi:phenylpyruvate tautomerase PptA (4-oxalocrotonate tautomerase family)